MATYSDTFEIANVDPIDTSTDWASNDSADSYPGGVEVFQEYATNASTAACLAVYTSTLPTTDEQEVAAWVTSFEESSTAHVQIGLGAALPESATYANLVLGVYARLLWAADGVRTLSIRYKLRNGTDTEADSITLVQANEEETEGYEGLLHEKGATGTLQSLRLVVTSDAYGMRARAYVNVDDDDRPVLDVPLPSDFVTPTTTTTDFGAWWFGFGDGSSARKLAVAQFYGADYDQSEDTVEQDLRTDQVSLAELRKRVKVRYARSSNIAIDDEEIDNHIRDAIEEILNRLGDSAWFMRREEAMTLSPNARGEVTLPAKVRRPLAMRDAAIGNDEWFECRHLTTDGAWVVYLPSLLSKSYRVVYLARHRQMMAESDPCPIPREHTELVVIGVCLRMAEIDRNPGLLASFLGRQEALFGNMQRDMNRNADQTRTVFRPRLSNVRYRRSRGIIQSGG